MTKKELIVLVDQLEKLIRSISRDDDSVEDSIRISNLKYDFVESLSDKLVGKGD